MTLSTLDIITGVWIGIGLVSVPFLLRVTAPYGRHATEKWGPMISNRLGWILQEAPSMIFLSIFFFMGSLPKTHASYFFWGLWVAHYINRSFIYPFRTKTTGKKIPLLIVASAIGFNFMNGFTNGTYLGSFGGNYGDEYFTSPRFFIGLIVFITGVVINHQSDNILLSLRKPGETGYKIPQGGLFKYISCPNLFGEMIEWSGYAILVWSLPALGFAVWTVVNLLPRALDHHKWYLSKFPDYPKERKALVPFVL
jgi:protein-S-isoprenylcysteine O-methyltransferase Ste14